MKKKGSQEPSRRQQKVNSFLQQRISEIIIAGNFFGITGLVTISRVEVSPDLRESNVWFTSFNQDPEEVLAILKKEVFEIQGELYKESTMRIVPRIHFVIDDSLEYNDQITKVLRKVKDE